jgi:hypothetical protein
MRLPLPFPHPRPHGHQYGGSDGRAPCQMAPLSPFTAPADPSTRATGPKSPQTAVFAETAITHRQTGVTAKNGRFGPVLRFIYRSRPPQYAQTFHLWPASTLFRAVAFKQTVDITQRPAVWPKTLPKVLPITLTITLATTWPRTLAKALAKIWPKASASTWPLTPTKATSAPRPAVAAASPATPLPGHV